MRKIKSIIAALAVAAIVLPGCKKFLDINENPNSTTKANPEQLLPSIEASVAHVTSYQYQTYGNFWSQYWTQKPNASQFRTIDAYASGPSDFDRAWAILYANALADTDSLIALQGIRKFNQWSARAYILRAYAFMLLTDGFGDIPLSEALNGSGNRSPHYDTQERVYDSVFAWIKKGRDMLDPDNDYQPGSEDILDNGEGWEAFANTLLLRAYLRISTASNAAAAKAAAGIQALYATNPTFLTQNWQINYVDVGGNQYPIWAEVLALQIRNQGASGTVLDKLKEWGDARIASYFNLSSGQYRSIPQGGYDNVPSTTPLSNPSARVLSGAAPGVIISGAESYFLQAEAALKGWGTGNAAELYEEGIRASFVWGGRTNAEATTYMTHQQVAWNSANVDTLQKRIITQKYFAMVGTQGFEAWSEWRRTRYPEFLKRSEASVLGVNSRPQRFVYPQAELTRNANFPGLQAIDVPVWWAKK
ncbi:SusD/RagB family nutrient-binding outer membrane lipoprotein [Chitinophaga sp. YIM B06452]|uniref:SusD/RagB family nutrient-binding outer membrane lipoprotein n=1 Tax=Chitinophaga sp. YIM B06452 TaxID=3082158 RepID=UPI0031FE6D36